MFGAVVRSVGAWRRQSRWPLRWGQAVMGGLTELVWVSPCPLCGRPGEPVLCLDCDRQLHQCQRHPSAQRSAHQGIPLVLWGDYRDTLRRSLHQLKYQTQPRIAMTLGTALGQHWLTQSSLRTLGPAWVIPIPLHPSRQQERGYNQAELIARAFCQISGDRLLAQGLIRSKQTTAQFGLGLAERQQNVQEAFGLGPELQSKLRQPIASRRPLILVDDIYTTGATLSAAIAPLQRHGFQIQAIAIVASGKTL